VDEDQANLDAISAADVTRLLKAWGGGDCSALERLTPLVYNELHRLARRHMEREPKGHLLQTSALVNEAYLRLVGTTDIDWQDRNHFFAVSARLMRQILIDFARVQHAGKRGNRVPHLDLSTVWDLPDASRASFADLDEALNRLAVLDERQAQVVELRFFGGLQNDEIAEVLKTSSATVVRDWRVARAWLYNELAHVPAPGD